MPMHSRLVQNGVQKTGVGWTNASLWGGAAANIISLISGGQTPLPNRSLMACAKLHDCLRRATSIFLNSYASTTRHMLAVWTVPSCIIYSESTRPRNAWWGPAGDYWHVDNTFPIEVFGGH